MARVLDLKPNSCLSVGYGDTFGSEEFKLLEVDEGTLKELLEEGLTIKGAPNDEAVLCTSTTTYAIKYVSTSNTVLLIPPTECAEAPQEVLARKAEGEGDSGLRRDDIISTMAGVVAAASGHLELVETAPRLDTLKALLNQRPYAEDPDGDEIDHDMEGALYTWDDLASNVQASNRQLKDALKALQAVQIGNYWRVVDRKFMQGLLEVILLSAVQHQWDLKYLREAEVLQVLKGDGFSPHIVQHCLACYGNKGGPVVETGMESQSNMARKQMGADTHHAGETQIWELDEEKVCLHYGKQLLLAATKWRLEDFVEAWQQKTPTGIKPSLEMLRGEALVDKLGPDSWLRPFSVSSLPTKPADRFSALFKERAKWEWEELEPYLRDMQAPGQSVEAMLLKYTRKIQPSINSAPLYTAR